MAVRLLGWTLGHERQRELLSAYLDGQLTDGERHGLERHLESCASCRAALDGLRATVMLLRDVPPVPLRRSFTLTAAMAESGPSPLPAFPRPTRLPLTLVVGARYASAVAAVLLFSVVSYDVISNGMPPPESGIVNRVMPTRVFEQFDTSATQSAPAPQRNSAPEAGAGGSAESASGQPAPPPGPRSLAPPTAPQAQPAPVTGPAAGDATATTADSPSANTMLATDESPPSDAQRTAAAEPPSSERSWLIVWLEAALASLLASAGALWWWGRRQA